MRLLLIVFVALTLTACANQPNRQDVTIQFNANQAPTETLARALENQGYVTKIRNERQIDVFYGERVFIMEPRITKGALSRIIVSKVYPIKAEHQNNPEIFVTLSKLNTHLTCAKYMMQPGNKAAEVQSSITFIDESVSVREVELFMAWMQNRVRHASSLVPKDTLRMFEF